MKILVIGSNPQGHATVSRALRNWSSTPKLVEVVDVEAGDYIKKFDRYGAPLSEEDQKPCAEGDDPPMVMGEAKNGITGETVPRMVPDPARIGRNSYRELEKDPRITIKQTDTVSQEASDAGLRAARLEVARLSDENLSLKARIAELETQLTAPAEDATGGKAKGKGKG